MVQPLRRLLRLRQILLEFFLQAGGFQEALLGQRFLLLGADELFVS